MKIPNVYAVFFVYGVFYEENLFHGTALVLNLSFKLPAFAYFGMKIPSTNGFEAV